VSGLPNVALVVPTYWTRAGSASMPGDAVYDHPTPVDEDGTLGRLLDSLERLSGPDFFVLVLVAVVGPDVEEAAERRVHALLEGRRQFPILMVGPRAIDDALTTLSERIPLTRHLLGLHGYAAVRNLQLAVPLLLRADAIVAVDDDEVVTDADFIDRAVSPLGGVHHGHTVDGVGGYYAQDETGRVLLDVDEAAASARNMFDRKAVIMNEATDYLNRLPGEIVPTPFCFGGNMIFSRDLARSTFFDPGITRGEDIDYLINARLEGRWFFMNKALTILHLPPSGGSYRDVAHHKVVQDILRFAYEREKIRRSQDLGTALTAADLWPYPGEFLTDDLDDAAREVTERIFSETSPAQRAELGLDDSPREFWNRAERLAVEEIRRYPEYRDAWKAIVGRLETDREVRFALEQAVLPSEEVNAASGTV